MLATMVFLFSMLIAFTAESLRCGRHVITEGDSQIRVLKYCGKPDLKRDYAREYAKATFLASGQVVSFKDINRIEEWTYNFGSNRFMYKVIFENGVVIDVDSLERGF